MARKWTNKQQFLFFRQKLCEFAAGERLFLSGRAADACLEWIVQAYKSGKSESAFRLKRRVVWMTRGAGCGVLSDGLDCQGNIRRGLRRVSRG
jgi:hypothetical protein